MNHFRIARTCSSASSALAQAIRPSRSTYRPSRRARHGHHRTNRGASLERLGSRIIETSRCDGTSAEMSPGRADGTR